MVSSGKYSNGVSLGLAGFRLITPHRRLSDLHHQMGELEPPCGTQAEPVHRLDVSIADLHFAPVVRSYSDRVVMHTAHPVDALLHGAEDLLVAPIDLRPDALLSPVAHTSYASLL